MAPRDLGSRSSQLHRSARAACAALALTIVALVVAAFGTRSDERSRPTSVTIARSSAPPLRLLEVRVGGVRRSVIRVSDYSSSGHPDGDLLARRLSSLLGRTQTTTRGRVTKVYRLDVVATARGAVALGAGGGDVDVVRRLVSTVVRAPIVGQRLRNNCESAALSILLSSLGRPIDQLRIQAALPTSGPLDPIGSGSRRVWGDPDIGYVGRADGGGAAGGFGVYPPPTATVGARFGVSLRVARLRSIADLRATVLAGRAAMLWVGLSDGPYGAWSSPSGRAVRVNFGEHTVVAYGVRRDGSFLISNPLHGTKEVWSPSLLRTRWGRLGHRALTGA